MFHTLKSYCHSSGILDLNATASLPCIVLRLKKGLMTMYDSSFHRIHCSVSGSSGSSSHHLACIDAWAFVNMSQTFTEAPFTNLVASATCRQMN